MLFKMKEKIVLFVLVLLLSAGIASGQIKSGEYDSDLRLAYNPSSGLITGVYENYSGYDESTGGPMFSCIFYIHGLMEDNVSTIETYYPFCDRQEFLLTNEYKHKAHH